MKKDSKFFTLMMVPHSSHEKVRQIRIPRSAFSLTLIAIVIASFALFYFVNDYRQLKEKLVYLHQLKRINQMQQEKIASLAGQIKEFNKKLNELKQTENRLRTLAGVGGESSTSEQLGKGGPEEYIPLEKVEGEGINSLGIIKKIENNIAFLQDKAIIQKKNFSKIEKIVQEKKDLFASTPNIFPVQGWISSGYGWRINPFTKKREFHPAIDIVAPWGTSVKAAAQGTVVRAGWYDSYGLRIQIRDGYGYSTVYGHLSHILVKKGSWVRKGQIIGRVGSTGRSTGPHLHFEVWHNGKTLNPLNLMVEPLG